MSFKVSTTGADVTLADLGLIVADPTTDLDLSLQFTPDELAASQDLDTAVQNGDLTLKITSDEYGEYEVDATEYYTGLAIQNQLIRDDEEDYVTEEELGAGFLDTLIHSEATSVTVTSTASLTYNVYAANAKFQKWKVAPNDQLVITGGAAAGTYTVSGIIDQTQITVVEPIVDTASVGVLDIYHPPAATLVGVDETNFVNISGTDLQTVLESIDTNIAGGGLTANQHKALRDIIHFLDEGPGDGFASGAYKEVIGGVFPTSVIWWESSAKLKKIVEKTITRTGTGTNVAPTPIVWKIYDTDGSTVLVTVTDTITYNGVFETDRTRTIA